MPQSIDLGDLSRARIDGLLQLPNRKQVLLLAALPEFIGEVRQHAATPWIDGPCPVMSR